MNRLLCLVFLVAIARPAVAQWAEPLRFQEKVIDLGDVVRTAGPVARDFVFTNMSPRPVRLLKVDASCGCTTPEWTREPVPSGKTGFVRAVFDPSSVVGYFSKTLTITTDAGAPLVLQMKGHVVNEASHADLPASNGSLRMKAQSISLGKAFRGKDNRPVPVAVWNAGVDTIAFYRAEGPAHLAVRLPAVLPPGARDQLWVQFDTRKRAEYGFVADEIVLYTNDRELPVKHIRVYTTVEDDLGTPTPEMLLRAPVFRMDKSRVDAGRVKEGQAVQATVVIDNPGKSVLEIRGWQSNCSCLTVVSVPDAIQAGTSAVLTLRFEGTGKTGHQQKALTLYTNDPRQPVQRITVLAQLE